MKFDALQEDFSAGELSPRAQGHINSDVYKAALSRMGNVIPTDLGTAESRAGGQSLTVSLILAANAGASPVHLIPLPASLGLPDDYVLELANSLGGGCAIGIQNRHGDVSNYERVAIAPFATGNDLSVTQWSAVFGNAFSEGLTGKLCLRPVLFSYASISIPTGIKKSTNLVNGLVSLSFTVNGGRPGASGVSLAINNLADGINQFRYINLAPGQNNVQFTPTADWVPVFTCAATAGVSAADITEITCVIEPASNPSGLTFNPVSGYATSTLGDLTKIRHTELWANGVFYCVIVGDNFNPFCVTYTPPVTPGSRTAPVWAVSPLRYYHRGSANQPTASTAACPFGFNVVNVMAYQNRLWFALKDSAGHLVASQIGYGGLAPGSPTDFGFNFTVLKPATFTQGATSTPGSFTFGIYTPPGAAVTVSLSNGGVGQATVGNVALSPDQINTPGGTATVTAPTNVGPVDVTITVTYVAGASDPLDLTIAQPSGQIAWLAALKGLLLGTTTKELVFSSQASLSLSPAAGTVFDLIEQSNYGSAQFTPSVAIGEKVMFATLGRQRLRGVTWRPSNNLYSQQVSGLVSDDISLYAEHLTEARIASMAFLRAPVPRLVMSFDDGNAAVVTFGGKAGQAWSRFSLPGKSIQSVMALDTQLGSELWVSTTDGYVMRIQNLDSKVVKKFAVQNGVKTQFDQHEAGPPVMDFWVRSPVEVSGYIAAPQVSKLGDIVPVILNGQYQGLFPVIVGGVTGASVLLAGALTTYVDPVQGVIPSAAFVGRNYSEHMLSTLPLEGGNPAGTSQAYKSRRVQCYCRFVDSYMPLVGADRSPERGGADTTDAPGVRVTGDRRVTQLGFVRGNTLTITQDLPLRMEISAIFGGDQVNST